MIPKQALDAFLSREPTPALLVRGAGEARLRQLIAESVEGAPLPFKTAPRHERQLEGLAFCLWQLQALLYYSPRTGKTWIALNWLRTLLHCYQIERALVIAHSPIGVDEWLRQAPIHSNLHLTPVRSGPTATEDFLDAAETEITLTTWSTLQQIFTEKRPNRKGSMKLYTNQELLHAAAQCFDAIVIDEIHLCANPDSLRFEIASGLASNSTWRLGMTGTPFGRNPFNLWAESFLADGGATLGKSYYFFEAAVGSKRYSHFKRTKEEYVFDQKKLPLVRSWMEHMSLHCRLEDIQDVDILPDEIELSLSPKQHEAYSDLLREAMEFHKGERETLDATFIRLRQVSSGYRVFIDPNGTERVIDFSDATKLLWLQDFAEGVDRDFKFVIFHEFVRSGERICEILKKAKISHAWLYGGTKDKAGAVADFQEDRVQGLVVNHSTGGTGIDLSAADYMCIFESPTSVIARTQMMARPMARNRPIAVDDLICSPVEKRILGFIAEGQNLNKLFADPSRFAKEFALEG